MSSSAPIGRADPQASRRFSLREAARILEMPEARLRALARDGLLGLGFAAPEIDKLLEGASGDTPEALITHALKVSRR